MVMISGKVLRKAIFGVLLLAGVGFFLKSMAGEIHVPAGFGSNFSAVVEEGNLDNCKAIVLKVSEEDLKKFLQTKGSDSDFLLDKSKKVKFEKWNQTPVVDFDMSVKSRLVHLGCDFKDKESDVAYEKKLSSSNSFYTFSEDERIFLLLDVEGKVLFYKYQGN